MLFIISNGFEKAGRATTRGDEAFYQLPGAKWHGDYRLQGVSGSQIFNPR